MSLFAELKRRNVFRAAAFYAASAWLLVQIATQVFPVFSIPDWVVRAIVLAATIGFPFAMLFSWFYEWTPQGIQRESEVAPNESVTRQTGRRLDRWIIATLLLAVVLLLTDKLVLRPNEKPAGTTAIPEKSVAVLPFANEGGDKDQEYFSDGLADGFITALSQFAGLKVTSRQSAFQFRESKQSAQTIGAKLGVAHLLEGSVRRAGETVRISAELINASDGSTLWSQHYDRPYKDLFALQDDITQAVATALQARLLEGGGAVAQSERPRSGNLAAYTALLQGRFHDAHNTEGEKREAIAQYQAAVKIDPRYAQAWAELSEALTGQASKYLSGKDAQQTFSKARAAADAALALEPNLAAAHVARGDVLLSADFDWAGAGAAYERAAQLAPNGGSSLFSLGYLRATLGHLEEAVALTRRTLATDPLHPNRYQWLSIYLCGLGRLDEAIAASHQAIEMRPAAVAYHERLAIIEILRGDAQAALAAAQAEPASGGWQEIALALARQIGPDRAAADAALKHLIEKDADDAPYQIAEVYALRRDPDQMFAWLDRAWTSRDPGIGYLLTDPFILRYQQDPRFAAFCQKVGLPTSTDAKAMP